MKRFSFTRFFVICSYLLVAGLYSNVSHAWDPCMYVVKKVTTDGGATWYDADTEAEAVTVTNGTGVAYRIAVVNCGGEDLTNVNVVDDVLGINRYLDNIVVGNKLEIVEPTPNICDGRSGTFVNTAEATATSAETATSLYHKDYAWVRCEVTGGGQGCTPGYWKQTQHFDSWPFPLTPSTGFATIFGVGDGTLLQALSTGGGGVNALNRHAVAALLNATSQAVSYDLAVSTIVSQYMAAYNSGDANMIEGTKNDFAALNELGCPLN